MQTDLPLDPLAECAAAVDPRSIIDGSRRSLLRAMGLMAAGMLLPKARASGQASASTGDGHKIILVVIGGVRRAETFSKEGLENVPHLANDLLPKSLFYNHARNEGVTAHFNAISSILTGNWQRVDDWGKLAPTTPTLIEQFRKRMRVDRSDTWIVASNKALTSMIGASSANGYGPDFGANVVFPKQLMLMAVADALRGGRTANMADRSTIEAELESAMQGSNYEGLGWNVFDAADRLDPRVQETIKNAVAGFVRSGGPTSGDELTFFMTREIMHRFSPQVLVVAFSDVEAAHFGSYSLHLSGIKTADRLTYQLWKEVEANPDYRGRTTMVVLPEFGRDPDGSSTNGFFNHRADVDSTRDTWMMVMGSAVDRPTVIERPIRHVDVCPTLAGLLGCRPINSQGSLLTDFRI
jgi:hypothetical protein